MKIVINGEVHITEQQNLAKVIEEFGAKPPFALALNGDFVAKSDYANVTLNEQDQLDIVSPIFGG